MRFWSLPSFHVWGGSLGPDGSVGVQDGSDVRSCVPVVPGHEHGPLLRVRRVHRAPLVGSLPTHSSSGVLTPTALWRSTKVCHPGRTPGPPSDVAVCHGVRGTFVDGTSMSLRVLAVDRPGLSPEPRCRTPPRAGWTTRPTYALPRAGWTTRPTCVPQPGRMDCKTHPKVERLPSRGETPSRWPPTSYLYVCRGQTCSSSVQSCPVSSRARGSRGPGPPTPAPPAPALRGSRGPGPSYSCTPRVVGPRASYS